MLRSNRIVVAGLFVGGLPIATCLLTACPDTKPQAEAVPSTLSPPEPVAPQTTWTDVDREAAAAAGKVVLVANECTRCHIIDDLPKASRPRDCAGCHSFLDGLQPEDRRFKKIAARNGEALLLRYQKNIQHLKRTQVPDLTTLAARVRPLWIDGFLRAPWDLRPVLSESMIRTDLDDAERQSIVRYFAARAGLDDPYRTVEDPAEGAGSPPLAAAPDAKRVAEGKILFSQKGCQVCHTFGNVDFGVGRAALEASAAATALAPNLRFVAERTRPEVLVDWIMAPQTLKPGTTMPAMGVSREDAERLATFLRFGDAQLKPAAPPEARQPKLLPRQVPYAEMKDRTLGKVCVHCHMNDYEKDPGPGNLGGLGYTGMGLSMRTYETLVEGALDPTGQRYSVLTPTHEGGLPPIIEVLLLRQREHARDRVAAFEDRARPAFPDARKGMPLGLPALSDEETDILFTWIMQGCEGPSEVSGKEGSFDGFLVRDGPIRSNKGCAQRSPDPERPAWAVDRLRAGTLPPDRGG